MSQNWPHKQKQIKPTQPIQSGYAPQYAIDRATGRLVPISPATHQHMPGSYRTLPGG
jgi:hypothetical protein